MLVFTQEERSAIAVRTAFMLGRCQEGVSWQKILSQTYCEFIPESTQAHGDLMARELLDVMGEFETMYDVARTEPKAFVRYYLNAATEGKTLEQQCRSLYSLVEGMKLFDSILLQSREEPGNPVEDLRDRAKELRYEGPVTDSARDTLLAQAANQMAEAPMTDFALDHITELLSQYPDQAHNVFGYACGDHVFQALCAMVIYTMAKNSELRHVPIDITLQQVTCAVCAEESMRRLVSDVEKGYIDTLTYRAHRKAIWQVLQIGIVAGLILLGGGAVAAAIAEEQIAAAVLSGTAALYGIALCIGPMDDTVQQLIGEEYIPMSEDTIPIYNNADEILSAYYQREDTGSQGYTAEWDIVRQSQQETPELLPEEWI